MAYKAKTTVRLSTKQLVEAMTEGTFTGKKINVVGWLYREVMTDAGRGSATYENQITGVILKVK